MSFLSPDWVSVIFHVSGLAREQHNMDASWNRSLLLFMTVSSEAGPRLYLCGSSPSDFFSYFKVFWKKNKQLKDLYLVFSDKKGDFYTGLELVCASLLEVSGRKTPHWL